MRHAPLEQAKPETEINYLKGVTHFCNFAGLSPSQVVERARVTR
jgi:hypothetical protein